MPLRKDARSTSRTSLPGNPLAPAAARRFARAALADWTSLGLLATCIFCPGENGCSPGQHSTDLLADDAVLIVDELVTNAVVHAGTDVELLCRLEDPAQDPSASDDGPDEVGAALVLEVSDHHPARGVLSDGRGRAPAGTPEYGRGLELVAALAERWGITYRSGTKTVWARLPLDVRDGAGEAPGAPVTGSGGAGVSQASGDAREASVAPEAAGDSGTGVGVGAGGPAAEPVVRRELRAAEILTPAPRRAVRDDPDWVGRAALSFLAEASDLLAGQLDEDLVAALACQLLVPRLADWCAVWLDAEGGQAGAAPRLARVWHAEESRIEELRAVLEQESLRKELPRLPESLRGGPVPVSVPWRPAAEADASAFDADDGDGTDEGAALACRLVANGRPLGTLLLGGAGRTRVPDEVSALIEDFARRVALAIGAARRYTRQATISRVLQRGLLPSQVARIPGVESALVYEPSDEGLAGGDFYDVFPCPPGGRWCFMLGDVQGSGPEAAVVTGLARPWLRLLAREGYRVGAVLDRLNRLLLDDATEAAAAVAAAPEGGAVREENRPRFLSLLYGELVPLPLGGGARCTLASAGHPLPLLLRPDGTVTSAATPQLLLGVEENVSYQSRTFDLAPGDTLLCVTDGVTERRSGRRMLDDGDGLARALEQCVGLSAEGVAERIRRAVHDFDGAPPGDDVALLVFQAGGPPPTT
ncbi:ATP-binding SpoIIE family protein phosphatase [Streptomyces liangshanensis]|uniref:ATP-binding SpoIIE family protein phosphatase n=1 Tax=Streptomyces liangshanensis TaxID=2717324 RepID=UPI001FBA9217|nr:ATP-binding SpoIIE family protein phosphatase [Streptomyces liangshanensis]